LRDGEWKWRLVERVEVPWGAPGWNVYALMAGSVVVARGAWNGKLAVLKGLESATAPGRRPLRESRE
jgi:hypothetical protein